MRDENGQSKGYGFVCFKNPADAQKALQTVNETGKTQAPGTGLYVSEAKDKEKRMAELVKSSYNFKRSVQYMNLYVKGFDPAATKEELEVYFGEFGSIQSLKVMPGAGMAFVCYSDRDGARIAKE